MYIICDSSFVKGSAYIFYSADGISGWSQSSKLLASDGSPYDSFGWSISVWGNVIVVGAYNDDSSAGADVGAFISHFDYCV